MYLLSDEINQQNDVKFTNIKVVKNNKANTLNKQIVPSCG